jgi:hypothetical protein
MSDQQPSVSNRRAHVRRVARGRIAVECRRGLMGLGPNLATAVRDLSQVGACIAAKQELPPGEEVELTLTAPGQGKPIKLHATVVRSDADPAAGWLLGCRFRRPLTYGELQNLT